MNLKKQMDKDATYCGFGKSPFIKPPYWAMHRASCFIHDQNYAKGGTRADRLKADTGFIRRMMADIDPLPYNQKRKAYFSACVYYIAVRLFGWIAFTISNIKNYYK